MMMSEIKYPPGCKDIQDELTNEELIRRLKKIQQSFQNLAQNAGDQYKELAAYLGSDLFLQHEHEDVQLLVACCIADVFRIFAPDSPFQEKNLKNIFLFLANQLKGLKENSNLNYKRYHYLLENLEMFKTFNICLELDESQEIIANLFESVFKIINDKTLPKVKSLFFTLLHPLLNESEQISTRVLDMLFTRIIEPQKSHNKDAYNLAVSLLKNGNSNFEFLVQTHLNNILLNSRGNISHNLTLSTSNNPNISINTTKSSNDSSLNNSFTNETPTLNSNTSNQFISDKLCLIIYELNQIRYALLELLMPQLEYKLKSSDLKERREYTKLLSKMFSEKDSGLAKKLPQLWEAYLERFADMNEDIRKICVQHICDFLVNQKNLSNADDLEGEGNDTAANNNDSIVQVQSPIIEQIIEQVKNRALDSEETLRFEVVQEILKAIKSDSNVITLELLNILKERTLDIKIKVRKLALQGLAALYKKIHSKANSRQTVQTVNWIPAKIMRIYFQDSIDDKLVVERLLNNSIVPYSLNAKEKMAQFYYAFTTLDSYSIMSLMEIMKNRVNLYKLVRSILDSIELSAAANETTIATKLQNANLQASSKAKGSFNESKLNADMALISHNLLDTAKGNEFMSKLVDLLKKNVALRNHFKNFVSLQCSCSRSMQLIQSIFTNLNSLNATQMSMAKRLIERMSSLIIDRDCFESLIDLVEYKIKQKLTVKQRRMLNRRNNTIKSSKTTAKTGKKSKKSGRKGGARYEDTSDEDDDDDEDEENDEDVNEEELDESDGEDLADGGEDDEDTATKTSETSTASENDHFMIKHIDDDGEKGLKLINMILMIHPSHGFASPITYQKLFSFVKSRKDYVVSATLKTLAQHYSPVIRSITISKELASEFEKVNQTYLDKLKHFVLNGKPKQAKYAIMVIFNNFAREKNEQILYELYGELIKEAGLKQTKNFVTCLVSLGHIAYLIPRLVGKEMKEFIGKSIVKEILFLPSNQPLNISASSVHSESLSSKRKNNLKLAGKWCENEEELPFNTRVRIESVKLIVRWCLGLKSECPSPLNTLKLLARILKENSASDQKQQSAAQEHDTDHESSSDSLPVLSEAEKSRLRLTCASQLIKMAQDSSFSKIINPELFHCVAKLIIDPVTNIRDIMIKKLQKALKANKLSIKYMSIFALCGFDASRERKSRVKKIYSELIKSVRLSDQLQQQRLNQQKDAKPVSRILPEMSLSIAVSLLAHYIKIDSLKDESKVKQIKECMSIILDPLLENPDSYQIIYIKKILNKIKISDDGMAAHTVAVSFNQQQTTALVNNKAALQQLYMLNKSLCFICEIFLFHMHSKSSYSNLKDLTNPIDVKLPGGFFSVRESDSNSSSQQVQLDKEIEADVRDANQSLDRIIRDGDEEEKDNESEDDLDDEKLDEIIELDTKRSISRSTKSSSQIEIVKHVKKRKSANDEEKENEEDEKEEVDESAAISKLAKKKLSHETSNSKDEENLSSSNQSMATPPPNKRNRLSGSTATNTTNTATDEKEEKSKARRSTRGAISKANASKIDEEENVESGEKEQEEDKNNKKKGTRNAAKKGGNKQQTDTDTSKTAKESKTSADATLDDSKVDEDNANKRPLRQSKRTSTSTSKK